jgi:hypothetical protein
MLHERWGAWSVKGVALDGVGIGVDGRLAPAGARPIAHSSAGDPGFADRDILNDAKLPSESFLSR